MTKKEIIGWILAVREGCKFQGKIGWCGYE
jgi:hypothetical protein